MFHADVCSQVKHFKRTFSFIAIIWTQEKTILEPEILGNLNINTGITLLLKTIVN